MSSVGPGGVWLVRRCLLMQTWQQCNAALTILPAGLVSIMAAKAFGAGKVAVVDMNETNLEVSHETFPLLLLLLPCAQGVCSGVADNHAKHADKEVAMHLTAH